MTVVELMREIHRLLKNRRELREQLERLPFQRKAHQGKIARREQDQHEGQDVLKKLKVAVHEKETTLKARHQQVNKYQGQLDGATSKKEFDALKHEIATVQAQIAELEDEILAGMMEVEERTAAIPKMAEAVALAKKEQADYEQGAKQREENLTAQAKEAEAKYLALEQQVPPVVRSQYDRIVKARAHDALASVRGRTCTACSTEITIQNWHDLQSGQFLQCTACGRILYTSESPAPPS